MKMIATIAASMSLMFAVYGCAIENDPEQLWLGPERGEAETIADTEPAYAQVSEDLVADESIAENADLGDTADGAGDTQSLLDTWTQWYDRDNPSGDGDWELRSLQAGVCASPTGVECRTISGLALWQTGEVVSCSTDGLLCLNNNQPDGTCNYDYKVRFLCPSCTPRTTCFLGECGYVSNGCGGSLYCGSCGCSWGQCAAHPSICCESDLDCPKGVCNPLS